MKEIIKETVERAKAETPEYFKGWRKVGVIMAGAGVVIKGLSIFFPPLIPVAAVAWASDLIFLGSGIAGISHLTKK